jgi:hypothetical protein
MGESEQTRQADFVVCPRASLIASLAVSNVAASQDLSLIDSQAKDPSDADKLGLGLIGCYVTFLADGGDVYIITGPSQASVTAGNVPVVATNGVNAVGVCWKLPANIPTPYKVTAQDRWLGYISASGTPQLRIQRSSPYPQAC